VIRGWFERFPHANIALALARSGLIAIDADLYKGDREKLSLLEQRLGPLPSTSVQLSGSQAGLHLIYQAPPFPIRGELGGVTLRGKNYIVIAPSSHVSGGRYAWLDGREPAALPMAWLDAIKRPTTEGTAGIPAPEEEPAYVRNVPAERRIHDAREHLARESGELKGVSPAGTAFNVCRSVIRGYGLRDPAEALTAIITLYNPRCSPPYSEHEIARRVVAAYEDANTPAWGSYYEPAPDKHRRVLAELGLEPKPHVESGAAAEPAGPVTGFEVAEHIKAAAKKLRRSTDASNVRDGTYLGRVVDAAPLVQAFDEDPVTVAMHTIRAAVRAVPPSATPEQILNVIAASVTLTAGLELDDIRAAVAFAKDEHARAVATEAERAAYAAQQEALRDAVRQGAHIALLETDAPVDDVTLKAKLVPSNEGGLRACGSNIEAILRWSSELRGRIRFDVLAKSLTVTEGRFAPEDANSLDIAIKNWLETHWGLYATTAQVGEQLLRVGRRYGAHDPLVEYLNGLTWDGVPRVERWLHSYCNAEPSIGGDAYVSRVGTMWMVSAVARAFRPGEKVDTVLVLEGKQGAKKSTALAILGGKWFCDTPIDITNKDSRMLAAQKWIVELAELAALRGRDNETLKSFLSAARDSFRPPYGRTNEDFERRSVFAGTTNAAEYLHDPTGARRFWAVKVAAINVDGLARDRDQLWAEAVHLYRAGVRWYFGEDEQFLADEVAEDRRVETPWASQIMTWWSGLNANARRDPKTIADVARSVLQIELKDLPRHQAAIGNALRECGFVQRRPPYTGKGPRPRLWYPPDDGSDAPN